MTKEKLNELVEELKTRISFAKEEAKGIKINLKAAGLHFVHYNKKEFVHPNYISFDKQLEIIQLGKLLRKHQDITEEDLYELLNQDDSEFKFLAEVVSTIPNFIEEARGHEDDKYLPYTYFNKVLFSSKAENVSV